MASARDTILKVARSVGAFRARDLVDVPAARRHLAELVNAGELVRVGRGLYRRPDLDATENHSLAQAAKAVPGGVLCLLTALRFHGLTTELPSEVWVALPPKAWRPRVESPRLRIARFSGEALTSGVETHTLEGVPVRIYSAAKTVADCFKYRNKIGTTVAVEALRDAWRTGKASADDLTRSAKVCRVLNVMRPYMESLL